MAPVRKASPSGEEQNAELGLANASGVFQHRVEDRLKLTGRAGDDLENLRGRRLLFAGLIELAQRLGESVFEIGSGFSRHSLPPGPLRPIAEGLKLYATLGNRSMAQTGFGKGLLLAFATSADVRSTAALRGKANLRRPPPPGSERTTKLVRTGRPQSFASRGCLLRRRPDAARCGRSTERWWSAPRSYC